MKVLLSVILFLDNAVMIVWIFHGACITCFRVRLILLFVHNQQAEQIRSPE